MKAVLLGVIITVVIYLAYLLIIVNNPRRLNKFITKGKECKLIKGRYKINYEKVDNKLVAKIFAIDNAAIIGVTAAILYALEKVLDVSKLQNVIIELLIGFLIFTFSILITYLKIGKYIKSKEEK